MRFLLLLVSLSSTLLLFAPASSAQTVVTVDSTSPDWGFLAETGSPSAYFARGPATTPQGAGSAYLGINGGSDGVAIGSAIELGTALADFTALSYWTYSSSPPQAPSLQLNVDYDSTDGTTSWQGRLVFEPYLDDTVLADTWQEWDTSTGSQWWSTGLPVVGDATQAPFCTAGSPCTWAEVLSTYPNAAIHLDPLGAVLIKSGSGWSAMDTYTDALRIATTGGARGGGVDLLYDFESATDQINTSFLSENGWYSDDTRADGTATMPEADGTNLVSPTRTDDPEATASGTADHDDDIDNQILFPRFGLPTAPPEGEYQGAVHLRIADGVGSGKSQISDRNDPAEGGDAMGFGTGFEILDAFSFLVDYSWMGSGTSTVTASFKLGFKTQEFGSAAVSSRTGENAWDKLLIYEPGNQNPDANNLSDGTWKREVTDFDTGRWWLVDRNPGGGITIGSPIPLADMATSSVSIGARTVADIWALLVDEDEGEEAILTSIQFGIGSGNAGGSVYVNQLATSFYRPDMVTTFGFDPAESTVICVPADFDAACELTEVTIQDALDTDGLGAEDVILVDSGVYAESLTIDTPVMLMGALAGSSACGRVGTETTITGSVDIVGGADTLVVDGFDFAGAVSANGVDDLIVRNSVFRHNDSDLQIGALVEPTIEDNRFTDSPARSTVNGQIRVTDEVSGIYVARNCFEGSDVTAIALDFGDMVEGPSRKSAISENTFSSGPTGFAANFGVAEDIDITGNTFLGITGNAIEGTLQNALILGNTIQGSGGGIALSEQSVFRGLTENSSSTSILNNCFFENTGAALFFSGSQATGMASNLASFNDIVGNASGAEYSGAETINVTNNFWGASDGPSGDGPGTGDTVTGAGLDFSPFLTAPTTAGTPCNPTVDLWVTKVDDLSDADVMNGVTVTYTIEVGNAGLFDAVGAQVLDIPPAGLDACSWTCSSTGDAACGSGSGSAFINETVDVTVGDTVTYEMACTFNAGNAVVTNTATVTANEVDTDPSNDSASAQTAQAIFIDGFENGNTLAWN